MLMWAQILALSQKSLMPTMVDMDMWLVSDTFQSMCILQQLQLQKKGYLLFIQLLKQLHPHLQFKWDENTQSIPNNQTPTIN